MNRFTACLTVGAAALAASLLPTAANASVGLREQHTYGVAAGVVDGYAIDVFAWASPETSYDGACATVTNTATGEQHRGCALGDVAIDGAALGHARVSVPWTVTVPASGKGRKATAEGTRSGTVQVDVSWAAAGAPMPTVDDPTWSFCLLPVYDCSAGATVWTTTATSASVTGSVTDSDWGPLQAAALDGTLGSRQLVDASTGRL